MDVNGFTTTQRNVFVTTVLANRSEFSYQIIRISKFWNEFASFYHFPSINARYFSFWTLLIIARAIDVKLVMVIARRNFTKLDVYVNDSFWIYRSSAATEAIKCIACMESWTIFELIFSCSPNAIHRMNRLVRRIRSSYQQ